MIHPTKSELQEALTAADSAHHEFELNFLERVGDEFWAGWYAAYVLGRLGEFTTPSLLTKWLQEAQGEGQWEDFAADYVMKKLTIFKQWMR